MNQHGEEVLAGEAWVMPSKTAVVYDERRRGLGTLAGWPLQSWTCAAQVMLAWGALGLAFMAATSTGRR